MREQAGSQSVLSHKGDRRGSAAKCTGLHMTYMYLQLLGRTFAAAWHKRRLPSHKRSMRHSCESLVFSAGINPFVNLDTILLSRWVTLNARPKDYYHPPLRPPRPRVPLRPPPQSRHRHHSPATYDIVYVLF
jgi:hypothetical protein